MTSRECPSVPSTKQTGLLRLLLADATRLVVKTTDSTPGNEGDKSLLVTFFSRSTHSLLPVSFAEEVLWAALCI